MSEKTPELVILVGIPASGKSTYVKDNFDGYYRVNLDSIHKMLEPKEGHNRRNNKIARTIESMVIEHKLECGESVVIDATNLYADSRQKYLDMADQHGAAKKAVCFEPNVARSVAWNKKRAEDGGRDVPQHVIEKMASKYQMPTLSQGYDEIVKVE